MPLNQKNKKTTKVLGEKRKPKVVKLIVHRSTLRDSNRINFKSHEEPVRINMKNSFNLQEKMKKFIRKTGKREEEEDPEGNIHTNIRTTLGV